MVPPSQICYALRGPYDSVPSVRSHPPDSLWAHPLLFLRFNGFPTGSFRLLKDGRIRCASLHHSDALMTYRIERIIPRSVEFCNPVCLSFRRVVTLPADNNRGPVINGLKQLRREIGRQIDTAVGAAGEINIPSE